jgi:hypothetical protein
MLKFIEYIIESKGASTAFSGHANEHFTHALLKEYINHVSRSLKKGLDYDAAHEAALKHMNNIKYEKHADIPEVQNSRQSLGDDEMSAIHNDSKKTATALLNHIKDNYGHAVEDSYHTGKIGPKGVKDLTGGQGSEADILLKTRSPQGQQDTAKAILEHIGSSLKYSKAKTNQIKIHSPTINKMAEIIDAHHKAMHGNSSGIHEILNNIGKEGIAAQRAALAKHHNVLSEYFNNAKIPKMTYAPVTDEHGNITGGALSQDAVSHIRDSKDPRLQAAYADMSAENLKMKTKIAATLHNAMANVLDHRSNDPNHAAIKESLLRSMGNLKTDKLPTFLVSTERNKPRASIYDTGNFFTQHLAHNGTDQHNYTGKSTFTAGPLSFALDARPTTSKPPITSFPINTTINVSDIKKGFDTPKEKLPKQQNPTTPPLSNDGTHGGPMFKGPLDA